MLIMMNSGKRMNKVIASHYGRAKPAAIAR
jgi:hypothetical protein